jgi:hypothetical protein
MLRIDVISKKYETLNILVHLIKQTYYNNTQFVVIKDLNFKKTWQRDLLTEFFTNQFDKILELVENYDTQQIIFNNSTFFNNLFDLSIFMVETLPIYILFKKKFITTSFKILETNFDSNSLKFLRLIDLIIYKLQLEDLSRKSWIYVNELIIAGFGDFLSSLKANIFKLIETKCHVNSGIDDIKTAIDIINLLYSFGNLLDDCLKNVTFLENKEMIIILHKLTRESLKKIQTWIRHNILHQNLKCDD